MQLTFILTCFAKIGFLRSFKALYTQGIPGYKLITIPASRLGPYTHQAHPKDISEPQREQFNARALIQTLQKGGLPGSPTCGIFECPEFPPPMVHGYIWGQHGGCRGPNGWLGLLSITAWNSLYTMQCFETPEEAYFGEICRANANCIYTPFGYSLLVLIFSTASHPLFIEKRSEC